MTDTTAITEYHPIEAALAQLEEKYGATVWVCDTPERLKSAKESRKEIRRWRLALEDERKQLKADVLARGRAIDGEAKRIGARIAAVEDPCAAAIKAEEDKERLRKEKEERIEQERIAKRRAEIDRIRAIPTLLTAATSKQIDDAIKELMQDDLDWLAEFIGVGIETRGKVFEILERMRDDAKEREIEAERLATERAELEKLRAEKEAREASERAAREAEEKARREKIEREEREARERIAAEERAARAARDKADTEARALRAKQDEDARRAREAEEKRQREERKRLDAEREEREKEERERRHKEAIHQEARDLLAMFVERYGKMEEFHLVTTVIREYLSNTDDSE